MKIINEAGFFAKLSDKLRQRRQELEGNKEKRVATREDYANYDEMLEELRAAGYDNNCLNLLQRYMLISKAYEGGRPDISEDNMLVDVALHNNLDADKIRYLGQIAAVGSLSGKKQEFQTMATASTVDQMKALYFGLEKGIPLNAMLTKNGKVPNVIKLVSAINNFAGDRADDEEKKNGLDLSWVPAQGYKGCSFLSDYKNITEELVADALTAVAYGVDLGDVKAAIDLVCRESKSKAKQSDQAFVKDMLSKGMSNIFSLIGVTVPQRFSYDQVRGMTKNQLARKLEASEQKSKASEDSNNSPSKAQLKRLEGDKNGAKDSQQR